MSSVSWRLRLGLALTLAPALFSGTAAAQTAPVLDHFKCYVPLLTATNPNPANPEPVLLKDQFLSTFAYVGPPVRFCNPVEKRRGNEITPIGNKDAHLKMYLVRPSQLEPSRLVEVRNQFGKQKLVVFNPEVLAVPSWKLLTPPTPNEQPPTDPLDLDHFLCYRAYGRPINAKVRLTDQFLGERTKVLRPFGLCNPVEKVHLGQTTPVRHKEDHLVCYTITPGQNVQKLVWPLNQFGLEQLLLGRANLLCVPSAKSKPTLLDADESAEPQ